MAAVVRELVDLNTRLAFGYIPGEGRNIRANGYRILAHLDPVIPHGSGLHLVPFILSTKSNIRINGRGISRVGDLDTCLDVRLPNPEQENIRAT